jgi:hypothetical protein
MRKKVSALVGAAALCLIVAALPVAAQAKIVSTPIKPKFLTNKLGAGTNATFHVDVNTEDPANILPSPGTHARVWLPKGVVINEKPFLPNTKGCTKARIDAIGPQACKSADKLGKGKSKVQAILGGEKVSESATVTAYGGPNEHGNPVLNLYVFAVSPISVQIVIKAVLHKVKNDPKYGYYFDADIPLIQTTPGNDPASILSFDVTTGASIKPKHGKKKQFLAYVPKKCPKGGFQWKGEFSFLDFETSSSTAVTPCPKKR